MKKNHFLEQSKLLGYLKIFRIIFFLLIFPYLFPQAQSQVTIEEKPLVLPTYLVSPPDKNPIFYTGRNYQGAQGHIYPQALYDVLTDVRKDQTYNAVYLNNEYLELCILPELGGRIFSALDKTDQYDFFYRQHVIKPALIGMTGAWISGGVEWNIPDHHRATSQLPIDYTLVENTDGSKTAWVGETELSRGLKWMVGLTVYPGKSYLEATVKVFNPTPFIHSFLYWANVSVHCDENYQVIFPPSTQYGAQHAKGEFTSWPFGSGIYGGTDRTGIDLSWWKNHSNPASIFAWNFKDDFLAGYDFKKDAGTVHVANHQVVTGKKFFLWGNNPEAKMWEKMLTEKDGQYLELMVGAYSDNQPDYSWIAPGETRTFKQYWYPVKKIGGIKNANTNAAVNLERKSPNSIVIGLNTTSIFRNAKIVLTAAGKSLLEEVKDISPATPYFNQIPVDTSVKDTELKIALYDEKGLELISYSPKIAAKEEKPLPIEVPRPPQDYTSVEELYLTGLRIEQFRNAVMDPLPYYLEALKRDSMDYRVNTILGIRYSKEGRYSEAELHLRRAVKRITKNYTHPKDGEAFYYLGVVLQLQNKLTEAADEFWKATWYNGFQSMAYFKLAQIACMENNYNEALNMANQSLQVNNLFTSALTLKAYLLRKTGENKEAEEILKTITTLDHLDNWSLIENYFLNTAKSKQKSWDEKDLNQFRIRLGSNIQNVLEVAKNYGNIGANDEAIFVLNQFKILQEKQSQSPLISYYLGFYQLRKGLEDSGKKFFIEASHAMPDYCFPWRLEELEILESALKVNPGDAKAWYYLGNIHYYLNQKEKATYDWEQSVKCDSKYSVAWRNLGFAYDKVNHDLQKSIAAYEQAIILDNRDPRLFAEVDVIKEHAGIAPADRLNYLKKHLPVLENRDDAIIRLVELYNLQGEYDKSLEILTKRHFHVWEGNGGIHDIFENSYLLQGIDFLEKKNYSKALLSFQQAATYPYNLEVGEPNHNPGNVRINYYIALAYSGLNNHKLANEFLSKVSQYNDRWNLPELKFYKALAFRKLGKAEDASKILNEIRKYSTDQLNSKGGTDFFAKFGGENRQESKMAYNYYLKGLSYLGEGDRSMADENFKKSLELDKCQLWAKTMMQLKVVL